MSWPLPLNRRDRAFPLPRLKLAANFEHRALSVFRLVCVFVFEWMRSHLFVYILSFPLSLSCPYSRLSIAQCLFLSCHFFVNQHIIHAVWLLLGNLYHTLPYVTENLTENLTKEVENLHWKLWKMIAQPIPYLSLPFLDRRGSATKELGLCCSKFAKGGC